MEWIGRTLEPEQVSAVLVTSTAAAELLDERHDSDQPTGDWLDLDKNWHVVHYLLTGTDWDSSSLLGQAVLGGHPVGGDDGYGPPRLLNAIDVAQVADALGRLDPSALAARYDPSTMRELRIYPDVWDDDPALASDLVLCVTDLRKFYAEAARRGASILIEIT